jgi:hypothetical protein
LGSISIDNSVVVDHGVTIDRSVIASLVDIGADTVVRNAVILSNSQIGSQLDICDMVIDGSFVYHVPTQTALYLDDQALFSQVERTARSVSLSQRLIAMLLLLLTAPLMLGLGLTCRRQQHPLQLLQSSKVDGSENHQGRGVASLSVTSFVSEHPVHARLPWLFSVLRGALPLFGAREEMLSGVVEALPSTSFAGVICLADFGPDERVARQIANLYQMNVQSGVENLRLVVRWLRAAYSGVRSSGLHANSAVSTEWHG